MRYLLHHLLILINCHIIQGVLEWTVIGKVTAFGQNVTLMCHVSNCCPDDSGWDLWIPEQRTLFIDVKTGRHNKKYDGKTFNDGYTLIIQNLTKEDLNVSYSCLYGVTIGERKLLLKKDVFKDVSNVQPNDKRTFPEIVIIAVITAIVLIVVVAIAVYFWKHRRNLNRRRQTIKKNTANLEETTLLNGEIEVVNNKYSQVYGSEVEINVKIPVGSTSVAWYLNGNMLNFSNSKKFKPVDVSNPSLKIYDLNKEDVGSYICKVVIEAQNGIQKESRSSPIEVEVTEPLVVMKAHAFDVCMGDSVSIGCDISYCPTVFHVFWEKIQIDDETKSVLIELNEQTKEKYELFNKNHPQLTIKNAGKSDEAFYRCSVEYETSSGISIISKSEKARLLVHEHKQAEKELEEIKKVVNQVVDAIPNDVKDYAVNLYKLFS